MLFGVGTDRSSYQGAQSHNFGCVSFKIIRFFNKILKISAGNKKSLPLISVRKKMFWKKSKQLVSDERSERISDMCSLIERFAESSKISSNLK